MLRVLSNSFFIHFIGSCPTGPEWGGDHVKFSVCSGRGECDRKTGNCQCNEGFSGKACQVMQCPRGDSPTSSCNGHGICVSEGNLIHHFVYSDGSPLEETYGWGKNRIYGCMCVGQYSGYDCTERIYIYCNYIRNLSNGSCRV